MERCSEQNPETTFPKQTIQTQSYQTEHVVKKTAMGIPEQQMQAISFVTQSMIPPLRIKVLERKFRNLKQAVLQPLKESRATKALKQNRYLQETIF